MSGRHRLRLLFLLQELLIQLFVFFCCQLELLLDTFDEALLCLDGSVQLFYLRSVFREYDFLATFNRLFLQRFVVLREVIYDEFEFADLLFVEVRLIQLRFHLCNFRLLFVQQLILIVDVSSILQMHVVILLDDYLQLLL